MHKHDIVTFKDFEKNATFFMLNVKKWLPLECNDIKLAHAHCFQFFASSSGFLTAYNATIIERTKITHETSSHREKRIHRSVKQ